MRELRSCRKCGRKPVFLPYEESTDGNHDKPAKVVCPCGNRHILTWEEFSHAMDSVPPEKRGRGYMSRAEIEAVGDASQLTHRAPVLAADGRPLREGEHVYHVETGAELVVKELPKPGEYQAVVVFALPTSPASHLTSFDPDQLTHERPDTWERIEDDAGCTATKYNERRGTTFTTKQQVARDLVRRARALAERDA